MLKTLFRKLAGPDPSLSIAHELNERLERQLYDLRAELAEAKASLDRNLNELTEATEHEESLVDQLATYRHLITALLLRYGETRLGGPILRAAASADFEAEHLGEQDCVELKLCD